jgi:hypothetical protein
MSEWHAEPACHSDEVAVARAVVCLGSAGAGELEPQRLKK